MSKQIDPVNDLETVKTEILLADINQIEKKLQKNMKKKMTEKQINLLESVLKKLNKGDDLNKYDDVDSKKTLGEVGLISIKPYIIVCNVDEKNVQAGNSYTEILKKKYPNQKFVIICADIEDQIMDLKPEEREVYMKNIVNIHYTGTTICNIGKEDISEHIEIPIPSIKIQEEFLDISKKFVDKNRFFCLIFQILNVFFFQISKF